MKIRRVPRVKRPVFDQSQADAIFFRNVFTDGLVGDRPTESAIKESFFAGRPATEAAPVAGARESWSALVDAAVLEDEVKSEQQKLARLLTTPVMFQTKFGEVNQSFEVLSALFAIISEYDGDVRWNKQAAVAQALFEQAAVSSRTGAVAGFRLCKNRASDLQELVRGGSIAASAPVSDAINWENAAHRSPLMVRLELANETAKKLTSNEKDFKSSQQTLYHEANIIAALAKVILEEGMPDADDDGYIEFTEQMHDAALELKSSVKLGDFLKATAASNAVGQSCSDCHAEWR